MADFPPILLAGQEDGRYREDSLTDAAHKQKTDGGYTLSRPRYTRVPRKTFVTGFTMITQAQRLALEAFWNSKAGGADTFTWEDPITEIEHTVRFGGSLKFSRAIRGSLHLWNVPGITLEEA